MNAELDRLPEMLVRLGLKAMRDRLDNLLDEAGRRDLGYVPGIGVARRSKPRAKRALM